MWTASFLRSGAIGFMMLAAAGGARGEVTAGLGNGNTLFRVQYHSAPVVEAELVAWRGEGWTWLGLDATRGPLEGGVRAAIKGAAEGHGTTVDGSVTITAPETATWDLRISEDPSRATDVFSAISFRLSTQALGPDAVTEIRPDKTGWTLTLDPSLPPIVVAFDAPVADLHFEPGSTSEIRAYVMVRDPEPGAAEVRMTLTVPGVFAKTPAERLAAPDETWWANDFHWNRAPVDLSFLNADDKPAGKRGFLKAVGEDLVFEDGTKARFWGTNISAYALFRALNPETVRHQAKRLAKLGFNLVRIHHHDSDWVAPNIFGMRPQNTLKPDPEALASLAWWIKCLRDEGIYVWIDLHVGRKLMATDGIEAFSEIAKGDPPKAELQGYLYVNDSIQARMREFAADYLSYVNPHTGLALKDDPAIVTVLVTNENDLTHHFGNALLADKNVPWHSERYMSLARAFATRHRLDADRVWRSWEFGPSKIFLADLEHAYFSKTEEELRALGVKVPIVGTNYWGGMGLAGLTALAEGDLVDAHGYGRANDVERDPRYAATLSSMLASGAVAGKPYTVSEWNVEPFPVFDRSSFPPQLAATASHQSWTALVQYAYSQSPMMARPHSGQWEAFTDPALMALMPASALLYRTGHVSAASNAFELSLPKDVFTGRNITAESSRAIRTLAEVSKLRIRIPEIDELPWSTPSPPAKGAVQVTDPDYNAIEDGATRVCSDTGELCRDWRTGVFTVDTARSQIASGWLGGHGIALKDVKVSIETPNATIAVQSLGDEPIDRAEKIMISMSAQAVLAVPDRLPYVSEPITGEIRVRARPGLKAYRADRDGGLHPMPFETTEDGYLLPLGPDLKANWLFLQESPVAADVSTRR